MSKRIYVDMDGTLCRFHDTEHKYVEAMWTQGFYINLKPFEEFLNGLGVCIDRNPNTEFFILSAMLDTEPPFVEDEKREWIHRYLPQIDDEHMIFTSSGKNKTDYIKEINSECVLIDDYNKNLNEWRDSGGNAIKFINDINNRGLGAYGGEKGELWNGTSIYYNQSSMDICLQIEEYAKIERTGEKANARYGFEGDVLPWDFSENILPYFDMRTNADQAALKQLSVKGEIFDSYTSHSNYQADIFKNPNTQEYMKNHNADKALILCLEECYNGCRLNGIKPEKINSWVISSIHKENVWKTYPVTPANVQMYITVMMERDKTLNSLFKEIEESSVQLKKYERQLFLPSEKDVADNYLLNGRKVTHMEAACIKLKDKLNRLKSEWKELAKAEYPNLAYGSSTRRYSAYTKILKTKTKI